MHRRYIYYISFRKQHPHCGFELIDEEELGFARIFRALPVPQPLLGLVIALYSIYKIQSHIQQHRKKQTKVKREEVFDTNTLALVIQENKYMSTVSAPCMMGVQAVRQKQHELLLITRLMNWLADCLCVALHIVCAPLVARKSGS